MFTLLCISNNVKIPLFHSQNFPIQGCTGRRTGAGRSTLAPNTPSCPVRRQSRAGNRPVGCIMKLHVIFLKLCVLNILYASAKIHGGPRGRFDKVPQQRKAVAHHHVSARHTHYSYHPPSHIKFMCRHCASMTTYPVYHGVPPSYVYKYRESGIRYSDLLTGLALYNLGRASEYWHYSHHYTKRADEQCSLQVIDRAHFEETNFPCFMMSTFLEQAAIKGSEAQTFDVTSSYINVKSFIQSTGSPVEVTREQDCVIWHNTTAHKESNHIPCALLKEYANTMIPSGLPVYVWLPIILGIVMTLAICCQCCCRTRKYFKDEVVEVESPLNQHCPADGYRISYN